MSELHLTIGNKNYSSWSLRPWFLLRQVGIPFRETQLALGTDAFRERIASFSPSALVPALQHGDLVVWDSLAICEYLADLHPELELWPVERERRAVARAVACEMHSGFAALRAALPMNCRASGRVPEISERVASDLQRIEAIWTDCRRRYGADGPWLFGRFSIADAMYVPVASRCVTYGVELGFTGADYRDTLISSAPYREWLRAAEAEVEIVEATEVVGRIPRETAR
jgi:glutathione S-transferase